MRTEAWAKRDAPGRTAAMIDVNDDEEVVVSYELMAQMLTGLGFERCGDVEP